QGDRARLLRWAHPFGDRRVARHAARHREGPDAARDGKDSGKVGGGGLMQAGSHQPYEDELAAYLLDALTTEESRAFQAHLQDCDLCQARERWLRTSVEVLPSSVEQLEPPPELRQRL